MQFRTFLETLHRATDTLTFGIEIEVAFDVEEDWWENKSDREIAKMNSWMGNLNLKWITEEDYTCSPGIEVHTVGPINPRQINELLEDVQDIAEQIEPFSPVGSPNCGLHIHVGGMTPGQKSALKKVWLNGIQRYYRLLVSPERSQEIQAQSSPNSQFHNVALARTIQDMSYKLSKKKSMLIDRGETMEFRFFHSTLMVDTIGSWIEAILNLCGIAEGLLGFDRVKLKDLAKMTNVRKADMEFMRSGRQGFGET